ncbi:MAG: type III PLP-dependent enzyme [Hamadaea sp.]|uniref:type III PLP-dependent enzyme n=1 Tax=Hamadaea sp. TaxID=2024425 RepID=UPI0018244EDE|nr:type III PLP-dependent enzyme [Hamadaea sp.]NUR69273.1 type III PLP-dependent enzyme [Hamadaea sp.]NUT22023.1 type III PLP-dependent enzyme [Hamadaea sp.]
MIGGQELPTPAYVYDLDEVADARDAAFAALPEPIELYYAVKANPHPELIKELASGEGRVCRFEISSSGELAAVRTAGVAGERCLYTGPGKTALELDEAIGQGVRMFSTDSVTDFERVAGVARRHGVIADCLLRINNVAANATTGIRMTGVPSQFGFDSEALDDTLPRLREVEGARIRGLHCFPLSGALDEASLIGAFEHTIELALDLERKHDLALEYLDIGGGFNAPYGVPGSRESYPGLGPALELALDRAFPQWRTGQPRIACESGRFLVGSSGKLLTRVTNVKVSRGRKFVILDAGINTFGGMSGLGRLLPVAVGCDEGEPVEKASLVGPLCTPGDALGREIDVPSLREGDLVAIPNAGAYGLTASLVMFLGRPAPLEVVVRGGRVQSRSRVEHVRSYDV